MTNENDSSETISQTVIILIETVEQEDDDEVQQTIVDEENSNDDSLNVDGEVDEVDVTSEEAIDD